MSEQIKKLAKKLKKENRYPGLTHSQILDKLIKDLGHRSWNHYCAERKQNETQTDV